MIQRHCATVQGQGQSHEYIQTGTVIQRQKCIQTGTAEQRQCGTESERNIDRHSAQIREDIQTGTV